MWDAHVDVNLKGLFFCCRAALPALRKSRGNIVNIASDAGLMGCPGITVYCGSKGGVVNMTRAMAVELEVPEKPVFVGERVPVTVRFFLSSSLRENLQSYDLRVPLFDASQSFRFLDEDDAATTMENALMLGGLD